MLASALLTFTHKSLHSDLHPIREGLPLWNGFLLWCSHPALASLILPLGATYPTAQDAHYGLGLLSFVAQSSCSCELDTAIRCHTFYWTGSHSTLSYRVCGTSSGSTEPVLASRCHLIKINLVLVSLTVLRSLSFLIPSFTKKKI